MPKREKKEAPELFRWLSYRPVRVEEAWERHSIGACHVPHGLTLLIDCHSLFNLTFYKQEKQGRESKGKILESFFLLETIK